MGLDRVENKRGWLGSGSSVPTPNGPSKVAFLIIGVLVGVALYSTVVTKSPCPTKATYLVDKPAETLEKLIENEESTDVVTETVVERKVFIHKGSQKVNMMVSSAYPKPCLSARADHILAQSLKNKMDYASRHGMTMYHNIATISEKFHGWWAKQVLFKQLLPTHPEVEWFLWMDSDAFVTDMRWEIPWERYEGYNMVVPGISCIYNETRPHWCCINAGIFLLRNNEWSRKFVDTWLEFGRPEKNEYYSKILTEELAGRDGMMSDDQSALFYLIRREKEKWGKYIYLEHAYDLSSWWVGAKEMLEEAFAHAGPGLTWADKYKPPFITHFTGCGICTDGHLNPYPQEDCFYHMERCYNFADNQIVADFGLQHANLSTQVLVKAGHGRI